MWSVENTWVLGPQVCNFIKKRLQHKCFTVKFSRTPFSTEQFWWLLFKISSSNNLFKAVSAISLSKLISGNPQLSQRQTDLKIDSLTKNVFRQSVFVTDLKQTLFFMKSHLNINNFIVLLHFLISYIFFTKIQYKQPYLYFFQLERSWLYQTTKVFLAFIEIFDYGITSAPSNHG